MRSESVLILYRTDLFLAYRLQKYEDVDYSSFKTDDFYLTHSVVIFIEDDGRTKIIKNRFGKSSEKTLSYV